VVPTDQEKKIHLLSAENLAIQAVLVHVLRHLAKSDSNLWKAMAAEFDDAANEVENAAIQHGAEAKSERALEALRIVQINRKASLGASLLVGRDSSEVGDNSKLP
jgi:hypothetical protein